MLPAILTVHRQVLLRDRWYSDSTGKYYFDARGIGFEGIHLINDDRYTVTAK